MRMGSVFAVAALALAQAAGAQTLPAREVTVFKDGHALVLREGKLPVAQDGTATIEKLPAPVLGTFWPYAAQAGATLRQVTSGRRETTRERDAVSLRELLQANLGAMVTIRDRAIDGKERSYRARVLALPTVPASDDDLNPFVDPAPPSAAPGLVLLQTDEGLLARPIDALGEVLFPADAKRRWSEAVAENRMTLRLDGARPGGSANLGVLYLQKGLRWIPGYKITIDGKGGAQVQLQATLVNELIDLDDATVNLVIGTPHFAFKETPDPIGLQDAIARLSRYFGDDARTPGAFSNAIMTQAAGRMGGVGGRAPTPAPAVEETAKSEDLFVFTVRHVTLKRFERMTLPVTRFALAYRDVYTLDLLPTPARNASGVYESAPTAEMARLLSQPKVMHQLRFTNGSAYPLTTAPALLFSGERLLAQSLMVYTPIGGSSDIALTTATDITAKRADKETGRKENALQADGYSYWRVDLSGEVSLRNFGAAPAEVEVTRYVLGAVDSAAENGVFSALDPLLDNDIPDWLSQYGNFGDRLRFTGLGKIFWKRILPAGGKDPVLLGYTWHYFTR